MNPDSDEQISLDEPIVRWSNGGCFGQCPVFTLEITQDGMLHYNGQLFVNKEGIHNIQLTSTELAAIQKVFDNANYQALDTAYVSEVVDISSVRIGYKRHNVLTRGETPPAFRAVRKYLNELLIRHDLIDNKLYRKEFHPDSGIILETSLPLDYVKVIAEYPEMELLHGRNINKSGTIVLLHTLQPDNRDAIVEVLMKHAVVKNVQKNRSLEKRG